jgi:hypothetical protein
MIIEFCNKPKQTKKKKKTQKFLDFFLDFDRTKVALYVMVSVSDVGEVT